MKTWLRTIGLLTLMSAAWAAPAAASTLEVVGTELRYTAAPGEVNSVFANDQIRGFTVQDGGVPTVTLGPPCINEYGLATCPAGELESVLLDVGDRNDLVDVGGVSHVLIPVHAIGGL